MRLRDYSGVENRRPTSATSVHAHITWESVRARIALMMVDLPTLGMPAIST
jgi:hypothetical protein